MPAHLRARSRARIRLRLRLPGLQFPGSLPEACTATAHNLALAHEFGREFGPIEGQVNVEVDAVKRSLWRIHALKVLFKILAREIRSEGNDFLDSC